ncbi:MAG: hypothetical protein FE78DRAFT_29020 [Acidomyces sp. 'richmondensis']|nr:MAG: hypothetical protein FE78DRAFT_29020 [Acidomyces sp. 'richmondensis']
MYVEDWEQLRPATTRQYRPYPHPAARFEEVDSEDGEAAEEAEDDEDDEGVLLDPNSYRDGPRFVSDELYFTGYDLGQDRPHRAPYQPQHARQQQMYDSTPYDEYYGSEEDATPSPLSNRTRGGATYRLAVREKEDALIASAMSRITRARAKGKTNVHLSPDEMEALERRQGGQLPTTSNPSQTLVSPPATPASTKKATTQKFRSGSRSGSATNLNQKVSSSSSSTSSSAKKKGSNGTSSPAKSNSKAKIDRKSLPPPSTSTSAAEHALPYPPGTGPPGIMVPGPNGVPVFAPIVNYTTPPSPEYVRGGSRRGESPRSAGGGGGGAYFPAPLRRPNSSGSARSLPDEVDWLPPSSSSSPLKMRGGRRNRSFSNAPAPGGVLPAAQGGAGARRNVSAPVAADVRYASLPRSRRSGAIYAGFSDPTMVGGRLEQCSGGSGSAGSSSSGGEGEDEGVQVEVVVQGVGDGGYVVNRVPLDGKVGGEGSGKKKRGKK